MGRDAPRKGYSGGIQEWEWKLIKELVRQTRSEDSDYLETALLMKLMDLKAKRKHARLWKDYMWIALRNHALNITQRSFHPKTVPLDPIEPFERSHDAAEGIHPAAPTMDHDRKLVLEAAIMEFSPRLRLLWETLKACGGSQLAAAKRLRKHPNTIANWVAQMRRILERHGLP